MPPIQKVASVISNSQIGKQFFEGPQFPKKTFQIAPSRPRETSQRPREAQKDPERPREAKGSPDEPRDAHEYKDTERRQNKPVKGLQRPLVAQSQEVASVISNSRIGNKNKKKAKEKPTKN